MWTRIALRYPIAWSPIENAIWHLSAENRCAGMVVMNDTPIAGLLANAESDGTFPPDTIFWLREYVSRLRLHLAGVARNNGNIEVARQLLWMARTTKIFSKQWRLLAIQLYTPGILLQTRRFLMSFLRSERSHCPYARHS